VICVAVSHWAFGRPLANGSSCLWIISLRGWRPASSYDHQMKFAGVVCFLVFVVTAGSLTQPILLRRKLENHVRGGGALDRFLGGFFGGFLGGSAAGVRRPEQARLMGKMAVVKTKEICGPRPFACARPQYKLTDYGVDMIFQGAFDEMQHASKKADPKALAASLGPTVKQAARSISTPG
jgi:hypothetical protein